MTLKSPVHTDIYNQIIEETIVSSTSILCDKPKQQVQMRLHPYFHYCAMVSPSSSEERLEKRRFLLEISSKMEPL